MTFTVEHEQEDDSRWLAEVLELPGVLAYGATAREAISRVQALALRVLADRIEHGEETPDLLEIKFAAAGELGSCPATLGRSGEPESRERTG